jgi:hypothetical protein
MIHYPTHPEKALSISDDDLCAACSQLCYRPGETSRCALGFPAGFDQDGYAQECEEFSLLPKSV